MMRFLLPLLFLTLASCASTPGGGGAGSTTAQTPINNAGAYALVGEMQVGKPTVKITNPDGTNAYYGGVGMRANVLIPVVDRIDVDVFLTAGMKYFDLQNTANTENQNEVANLIGPTGGLALRWTKFIVGTHYSHIWARHYATGQFSGRSTYYFTAMEYYAGLHYQFGRLGVGLTYSMSSAEIDKQHTDLNSSSPYNDSMISLQFTFNTGQSLWSLIKSLF